MNGLEITPENVRKARFTRPYYIYQLQLVGRIDDNRFTTLTECKEQGLKVGTLEGSAAAKLLQQTTASRSSRSTSRTTSWTTCATG